MAFLVMKNHCTLYSDVWPHPPAEKRSFNLTVIGLHKLLLIILFAVGMIYLVSAFLNYFYGIALPLRVIYLMLARIVCVLMILGYAIRNSWTRPHREKGLDITRASALVLDFRSAGAAIASCMVYALLAFIFGLLQPYRVERVLTSSVSRPTSISSPAASRHCSMTSWLFVWR